MARPYRTFTRTWWADDACTEPQAGERHYTGQSCNYEDHARAMCDAYNLRHFGPSKRGPRGLCMEYTSTR